MDKHIVKQWIGILLLAFIVCGLGWLAWIDLVG